MEPRDRPDDEIEVTPETIEAARIYFRNEVGPWEFSDAAFADFVRGFLGVILSGEHRQ